MTRKKKFLMAGIVLTILAAVGGVLVVMIRHEPGFYRRNTVPAGKERKDLSMVCFGQGARLLANYKECPPEAWSVTFSEAQINSFFLEDFLRLQDSENLKNNGISDPRISIEKDRLRLAFRYGNTALSGIFSIDTRIWLVPTEHNVFAVEILSHQFGALPISMQSLRDDISELAKKHNIEVTWYRHDGHPVALLRIQSERKDKEGEVSLPPARLVRIDMQAGTLTIAGKPLTLTTNAQQPKKHIGQMAN